MKQITACILTLLCYVAANADCTSSQGEFQEKAPLFLIQQAAKESKGATSDFGAQIGKDASAGTTSLKLKNETLYFVMANFKTESVSGVVRCDRAAKKMVVVSLGWSNSKSSGVVGGTLE